MDKIDCNAFDVQPFSSIIKNVRVDLIFVRVVISIVILTRRSSINWMIIFGSAFWRNLAIGLIKTFVAVCRAARLTGALPGTLQKA